MQKRRFILLIYLAVGVAGAPALLRAQPTAGSMLSPTRIVHQFDFDERGQGNLEDLPKFWEPLRPDGFPHYTSGGFDLAVGRSAPPSFYLACEGRNVAYQYSGLDTRVRRNTDYRIVAFIRGDQLRHARACLSAHFIDKFGRTLPETLVRSRYIGGGNDYGWVKVELHLPAAPAEAYTVGLVAWVLQDAVWRQSETSERHIPRNDVTGGAWFDDITIYALPHIELSTGVPGNVLPAGESKALRVVFADEEAPNLYGRLSITSADGEVVETQSMKVAVDAAERATEVPLDHLPPGLYRARLDVYGEQTEIASRELTFACVADVGDATSATPRSFGIVIDPESRSESAVELAMLKRQLVRSAKIPVWTGSTEASPSRYARRTTDRFLHDLVKGGFDLTAVFSGLPGSIARSEEGYTRSLIELLAGDPEAWREELAAVVAPYSGTFRWWQVGPDPSADDLVLTREAERFDDQRRTAITRLRDAMLPFITTPRLAAPSTASVAFGPEKLPVKQITLSLGHALSPQAYASQIDRAKELGYEHVSVYVEPLPAESYDRRARLADWTQRLIQARMAGADSVFVPQTWHVRATPQGRVTEPLETYVVLHTIAAMIGDGGSAGGVRVAKGVRAFAFHRGERSTIVMWDPHAPPDGRAYPIQLGQAVHQVDVWGRLTPLERDAYGRHIVRLTPSPIFVPDVERWLVEFRTSIALTPDHVESGSELVRHIIEMDYRGNHPLAGQLILGVPASWQVAPRVLDFSLMSRRSVTREVNIHYPHNEPAAANQILAKITLPGESYYMEVPLGLELGVSDLAVWGLAALEGEELVLRHVVTNRSSSVLSFRGSVALPGRERQYRPISNLQPGDTQTVEYRFSRGRDLIGRDARLVLREVNDGPRIHNLKLVVR